MSTVSDDIMQKNYAYFNSITAGTEGVSMADFGAGYVAIKAEFKS